MKFNEVTWYSKLGAIILFIGVLPALTFYIGRQYEKVNNYHEYHWDQAVGSEKEAVQAPSEKKSSSQKTPFINETHGFAVDLLDGMSVIEAKERETEGLMDYREVLATGELYKVNFLTPPSDSILQLTITSNPQALSIADLRQQKRQSAYEADVDCIEPVPFGCFTAEDLYVERGEEISFAGIEAYKQNFFEFDMRSQCINFTRSIYEYNLCYDESNPNDPNFFANLALATAIVDSFRFIE